MTEGQTSNPPSLGKLALITLGAGAVATLLTVLVVLPAEFGRDPTGFGQFSGLKDLAGTNLATAAAHFYDTSYRSDVVEIPLVPKGDTSGYSQLEYKVRLKTGDAIIYSWDVTGAAAGEFYSDLHAETGPNSDVIEFKQETALRSNGSLVAPAEGVHGWYWRNQSANKVVVRLKMSGFYELIPPGEKGNKAGIMPTSVTARTAPVAEPAVQQN